MKKRPLYEHDCKDCIFLGTFENADLYFCTQGNTIKTIIARFGNEGPSYISGLTFKDDNLYLKEAYKRSRAKGLL